MTEVVIADPTEVVLYEPTREPAWAKIGHQFESAPDSTEQALAEAGLDWEVRSFQAGYLAGGEWQEYAGRKALVRSDTLEPLSVVSDRYNVAQNYAALSFVDELLPKGEIVSVWEYDHGREVGMAFKFGEAIESVPGDCIQPYVILTNRHDGLGSVKAIVHMLGMHCWNQMAGTLGYRERSLSIVHTTTLENAKERAEMVITTSERYIEAHTLQCVGLAEKKLEDEQFEGIVKNGLKRFSSNGKMLGRDFEAIEHLYRESPTMPETFQGTAYAADWAVSEYVDHYRPFRSGRAAFRSTFYGLGSRLKKTVHADLLKVA